MIYIFYWIISYHFFNLPILSFHTHAHTHTRKHAMVARGRRTTHIARSKIVHFLQVNLWLSLELYIDGDDNNVENWTKTVPLPINWTMDIGRTSE